MVKFKDVEKLISRINPETVIFATGGHLITGHGDAVGKTIKDFIRQIQD
jgi:hypothetical protein